METLLEAINIGRLDRRTNRWLLENVNLRIGAGERIGIQGPTGVGKTLLLRCLALLDVPEAGAVQWRGKMVHGEMVPRFRAHTIYLHQKPTLFPGSVADNLKVPFRFHEHQNKNYDERKIKRWLENLGRDNSFLSKSAGELSGGEMQMVALMRALQLNPDILLLDEPTSALDASTADAVERLIDSWWRDEPEATSYVWVSHQHEQLERMASRLCQMAPERGLEEADA